MIRPLSILSCALLSPAAFAALSTFDLGVEGWTTVNVTFTDPNSPTTVTDEQPADWSGTDGLPLGSLIHANDGTGGNDWRFFSAPGAFLGDRSLAFGTDLTYDTKTDLSDGVAYPAVILRSGKTFLYHVALPPASSWTSVSVPLVGSAWSTDADGLNLADDAALKSVLGKLDGLYIDADWYSMPAETVILDNVNLRTSPVPEPATVIALVTGISVLIRRRRAA